MKKLVLMLAAIFTFSTALVSCRDTETEEVEIENVDDENAFDEEDNAFDDEENDVNFEDNNGDGDIEDAIEEGANEAAENTGVGGTDDI